MNTPRLFARPQRDAPGLSSELLLRYGAATLVTLIALAAAQLVLPTQLMLVLGTITLAGAPVSLWMRLHHMRIGGFEMPRPLWNALTVIASLSASALFLRAPLINILGAVKGGLNDASILSIGATEPMLLLVQLFLIFAAFRSFSLISDKDATLATVPSFSVLLLLIPVYPNIEVVCYFIVWTLIATMLFALDHRSEIRAQVMASVPAPAPGQDVKLAARSLAGVLAISLVAAIALSGLLTARDPREGASSESAISMLAMRLTRFSLQSDGSANANGPQRQIDFATGIALPTRAELWRVSNIRTTDGSAIDPSYWRLFTLSDYDGLLWSQWREDARQITRTALTPSQWPRPKDFVDADLARDYRVRRQNLGRANEQRDDAKNSSRSGMREQNVQIRRENVDGNASRPAASGFAIADNLPRLKNSFGTSSETVRYTLEATRTTLGFLPLLPTPTVVNLPSNDQDVARARADGSVDMSIIAARQVFRVVSQVPAVAEYGIEGATPPSRKVEFASATTRASMPAPPTLSPAERARYLALPAELPARVRQFASAVTRGANASASNYARAQMLARATQNGAIYTLRPPQIPAGRDAADFFLFDSRRGYCTYFAGALTVLCRAQNIPARVVSGFVAPDWEAKGQTVLRDANAHAWTEIWIENWGWATVDATPPGDRGDNAPTFLENWNDLLSSSLDNFARWFPARWPLLLAGALLLLLIFVAWRFRTMLRHFFDRSAPQPDLARQQITADYERAARQLARRFRPRQPWETPTEWLSSARAALPHLPFAPMKTLTELYVRAQFSPLQISNEDARRAQRARARVKWPKRKSRAAANGTRYNHS